MKTIVRDVLEEAIEQADTDAEVYAQYGGRGMYGQECLGLIADDLSGITRIITALTLLDQEAGEALSRGMRRDAMGKSTIYYWPGVTLVDE